MKMDEYFYFLFLFLPVYHKHSARCEDSTQLPNLSDVINSKWNTTDLSSWFAPLLHVTKIYNKRNF